MIRAFACAVALFVPSVFAAERPVVLVLPPVVTGAVPDGLALVIQERANAEILGAGYPILHARQIAAMLSRHRIKADEVADPNVARSAAERLGAKIFVSSSLSPTSLEIDLSIVGEASTVTTSIKLPPQANQVVAESSRAISAAVFKSQNVKVERVAMPQPSDAAARDYAGCTTLINRQPIGIENPTVLNENDIRKAMQLCTSATKTSPQFVEAWAGLALAAAIDGEDAIAISSLQSAKALNPMFHVPNLVLARFWLATRYQSNDAGIAVLKDSVAKTPGFLLARGYLGELYNTLGQHAQAATVWKEYAAMTPNAPFVISRLAYTLARLGQPAEAAAFAEKALSFDRDSLDLNLELASRYLDAGNADKAIAVLEPLAKPADARAEVVLRLGYAKQVKGDLDSAEKLLARAISLSTDPADWRTRARAKINLATIALKRGKKDDAKKLVSDAIHEGLTPSPNPETKDVWALVSPEETAKLRPAYKGGLSPLPLSGNDVDPTHGRAAAPKGLDAALK